MENEKPLPIPLTGDEVKAAILVKVEEALIKSCHLKFDNAYTSFAGEISIRLVMQDYGRPVPDNHVVHVSESVALSHADIEEIIKDVQPAVMKIDPAPPNQVRIESGMDVPVKTVVDGRTVIRKVKYSPRKLKSNEQGKAAAQQASKEFNTP